jgi:ADP-heptose:LPS heptosyltransferase
MGVMVLLGPEERDLRPGLNDRFGKSAFIIEELPLIKFFSVLSILDVMVTGDTGPMHLGALAGAPIVMISEAGAPDIFHPVTDKLTVLKDSTISELKPETVASAVRNMLPRTEQ